MENEPRNEDAEVSVAQALGRSLARQRRRDNLRAFALLLVGASAVFAIHTVLKQSYYLVMAAQIGSPWVLYCWLSRKGLVGVFLSWMWSSILSFILTTNYLGYAALVDRSETTAIACGIGGILFAAIGMHRRDVFARDGRAIAVFVYSFVVMYSYTVIFQLNCLLDRSTVTIYRPVVLEKVYGFRLDRGLLVESWSPDQRRTAVSLLMRPGAAMVPPSHNLFKAAREGDTICILQRVGRLGMSWYTAQIGSWGGEPVPLGPWGATF